MITDEVLQAVETALANVAGKSAEVVPKGEAYPTSGNFFIRVSGNDTTIEQAEQSVTFIPHVLVECSVRTRRYPTQLKKTPYYALIDLQERCYLHMLNDQGLVEAIQGLGGSYSYDRVTSARMNTKVVEVPPSYFGSNDRSNMMQPGANEAGFVLDQSFQLPKIEIPFDCLTLNAPFNLD